MKSFFSFHRKGELPLEYIVIAVILLVVAAVVIWMIINSTKESSESIKQATTAKCDQTVQSIGTDCEVIYGAFPDLKVTEICCKNGTIKT
ncbi:hypothetical protein COV18_03645 [Candidatus Woesearchaeota archaeon CG10_big_fil_rev_8_21_14_0_10_37_12]|nr:MAG: hypothetical protein COV18_03645 [Candidatus Woesearchaeota archaeon CG10_big_fil_rev_8_21_14_0_10_37_12]